jgi:hypothetical protein
MSSRRRCGSHNPAFRLFAAAQLCLCRVGNCLLAVQLVISSAEVSTAELVL